MADGQRDVTHLVQLLNFIRQRTRQASKVKKREREAQLLQRKRSSLHCTVEKVFRHVEPFTREPRV